MERWLPWLAILGISALAFHFALQTRTAVQLGYEMEYIIAEACSRALGSKITLHTRDRKEVKIVCVPAE